jgi:hypothetical protein
MASSIIIDLRFFLRRRDLPPGVDGSVERLKFFRYGSSDLVSPDRSWIFSHSFREEYYPRNNFPGCYVLDNGDLCSRLPCDIDQDVRLLFPSDMGMPFGYPQISIPGPAHYGSVQVQGLKDDLETKKEGSNSYSTRTLVNLSLVAYIKPGKDAPRGITQYIS